MVNLPKNIDYWTIGTITDILHEGYYETNTLEFKENLSKENERIARTCCSFSNTNGGIIIFGVSDDREKNAQDRIVGLNRSDDNIVMISNQIKNIIPEIPLENIHFSSSPIQLQNDKDIILLKIAPSNYLHQFDDKFYKRLQGNNEPMPYDEIKTKFIENRKNRRFIILLQQELGMIMNKFDFLTKNKNSPLILLFNVIGLIEDDSTRFFLYNQSFMYKIEVQECLTRLIEVISKLRQNEEYYLSRKPFVNDSTFKKFLKINKFKSTEELSLKDILQWSTEGKDHIAELENLMNFKIIKALNRTEYATELKKRKNLHNTSKNLSKKK